MNLPDYMVRIPGCRGCTGGDVRGLGRVHGGRRVLVSNTPRSMRLAGFFAEAPPVQPMSPSQGIAVARKIQNSIAATMKAMVQVKIDILSAQGMGAEAAALSDWLKQGSNAKPPAGLQGLRGLRGFGRYGRFSRFGLTPDEAFQQVFTGGPGTTATDDQGQCWGYMPGIGYPSIVPCGPDTATKMGAGALALEGSWERYCDENYADPDTIAKCKHCPHDLFGNCISPPPWTEVGAAMRGIPKAHGTISGLASALATAINLLPSPSDYDPVNLIVIGFTDPVKTGILSGAANLVVPGLGQGYVAQFVPPQAFVSGFPIATAAALAEGGWDRVWNGIYEPILDNLGDQAEALLDYALSGNSALVRYAIKRITRTPGIDPMIVGILSAVRDASGTLIDDIRNPSHFLDDTTFSALGHALADFANGLKPSDPNTANTLGQISNFLIKGAQPISYVLKLDFSSLLTWLRKNLPLIGGGFHGLGGRFDFGRFDFGYYSNLGDSNPHPGVDPLVLHMFDIADMALQLLSRAVAKINIGQLSQLLNGAIGQLDASVKKVIQEIDQQNAAAVKSELRQPAGPPTGGGTPGTQSGPGPSTPPVSHAGATIAGATGGLIVGGPVGAAIGGGAGFLLSKIFKK